MVQLHATVVGAHAVAADDARVLAACSCAPYLHQIRARYLFWCTWCAIGTSYAGHTAPRKYQVADLA